MIQEICLILLKTAALYFLSINLTYGILMMLSWLKIKRYRMSMRRSKTAETLPAVTFIIPAFNEESLIVETIQTYLSLPQEKKEIIVINDGSHDQTFKMLQTMFQLKRSETDEAVFHSITNPGLKVLEASHMGKAQALNFGVSYASHDLICTMDADTIPTARGVEGCLQAFAADSKLVAAGGVIQVLNSQVIKENVPSSIRSKGWLTTFQGIEYLRTFLCERLGWSFLGSTILISGAFCMVKKEALKKVGGFRHNSITEDFDLIVRLRKAYRGDRHRFRILPITTCYTQVPKDLKHLMVQRMRWQMGLVDTLAKNLDLILHPGHGLLGLFAVPYFWMVEVLSPVLEVIALILVPYALYQGWLPVDLVLFYLVVGLVFNIIITLLGIYLDNRYVSKNKNWSCFKSTFHTLFLHFGYKQLTSWWRLLALFRSFRKNHDWGIKPRQEITHQG